jgi:hypothetical protein
MPSEPETWLEEYGGPGMPVPFPGAPRPTGRLQRPFDEDFLERVRQNRAARRADAPDGFFNASRPPRVSVFLYYMQLQHN